MLKMTRHGTHLLLLILIMLLGSSTAYGQNKSFEPPLKINSGNNFQAPGFGQEEDDRPKVFASAEVKAADGNKATVFVTADIDTDWHIYSITQPAGGPTPTKIILNPTKQFKQSSDFVALQKPVIKHDWPGNPKLDVEEHHNMITWSTTIELAEGVKIEDLKLTGMIAVQVCTVGKCLEESPTFTAEIKKYKSIGTYKPSSKHSTIKAYLNTKTAAPGSTVALIITAEPTDHYHFYEIHPKPAKNYNATLITLTTTSGLIASDAKTDAKVTVDTTSGTDPLHYYDGPVTWTIDVKVPKDAEAGKSYRISGIIGFHTCTTSSCDLREAVIFEADLPVTVEAQTGKIEFGFIPSDYEKAKKAAEAAPEKKIKKPVTAAILMSLISFSLIGGFILNFMPCVLPVIGLKIISFAQQAGEDRSRVLKLNIAYSVGIICVCMVLAVLLTFAQMIWGEQFQSPTFVIVMTAIVFTMALSFLGVWEIPIPGFVGGNTASELSQKEGYGGAFFKGILTTILATPCSGPFLGAIFGTLLFYPSYIAFLSLFFVGLGLASPYLIIGAFPKLVRFIPKPGAWMDTFKQVCGLLMLGAVAYLFGILQPEYLKPTFWLIIGLWVCCWCFGRAARIQSINLKYITQGVGLATAILVGVVAFNFDAAVKTVILDSADIDWQPYSKAALIKARAEGKTVMVDFTADWCPTCKANLYLALERQAVVDLLEKNRVVPMKVDMTVKNPELKSFLQSISSNAIPVLAFYHAGETGDPVVVPDVVTQQQVLDHLTKAGPSKVLPKPKPDEKDDPKKIAVFKKVSLEGDFNIKMPILTPARHEDILVEVPPIKVKLVADKNGQLVTASFNGKNMITISAKGENTVSPDTEAGKKQKEEIRKYYDRQGKLFSTALRKKVEQHLSTLSAAVVKNIEIEFDCDKNLKYKWTFLAITAVNGKIIKGKTVPLIEKISFTKQKNK